MAPMKPKGDEPGEPAGEGGPPVPGSLLPGRRLTALLVLWAVPVVQYALFSPMFSDARTGVFPLTLVLAILVVGIGCFLVAYRILRPGPRLAVPMQELGLFALGGVTSLVSLSIFSTAGEGGTASLALAALVTFLMLLVASVIHSRIMDAGTGFFAPTLAGALWPLLVPLRTMVEAIWRLTPWVFDSITLSVMAGLLLLAVLAIYFKATVPVTVRDAILWVAAVFMIALVPVHEVLGVFSNMVYGSVDRSVAFTGLMVGVASLALFLRRNHVAGLVRAELEQGDELRRGGHQLEAVRHYDLALGMDSELAHAWTGKELALRAAGADIEAQKALREVLRLQPDSEGALNEMGVILRRQGKLKEAMGFFDRTLERNPAFVMAWNNKGNALQDLHRVREAIRCYDRALELNPAFEAALVNKARALASIGRFRAALDTMDLALELKPGSEAGWNEKGLVYMKMTRYDEALAHFDKALKLNPRFEAAWNNRGNALMKLGRASEALHCYNRALQLNVEYYAAWYNEGSALIDSGDIAGAIKCLDEAIRLNPTADVAWNERGVALRKLGKLKEAAEHFERAVMLNPGFVAAWNNRGNSLMDQGRTAEAFHCYNVATIIDPNYDKAWYNKGCALLAMGKTGEAMSAFERSVSASLQSVIDSEAVLKDAGEKGEEKADGENATAGDASGGKDIPGDA